MFEKGSSIFKELGDRKGQAVTLKGLGHCYSSLGQHTKAMELYEQVLPIKKELGDRVGQAASLSDLGNCYYSLGQHAKVMELFARSARQCDAAVRAVLGHRTGAGRPRGAKEDAPRPR